MNLSVTKSRDRLVLPTVSDRPVQWRISTAQVGYDDAVAEMEARVDAIARGEAEELVWLLEHPPLYTAGTSARDEGLPGSLRGFPVHVASRGGQVTYHGPGQRVAYVMLDLTTRGRDVRCFVAALEEWLLRTLAAFNIRGERRENRVGVWVPRPEKGRGREDKIAAIGVRVRRWATFHGVSLNIDPDLSHFDAIVPCGVTDQGVTSFEDLGRIVLMSEVDAQLRLAFEAVFGRTVDEIADAAA